MAKNKAKKEKKKDLDKLSFLLLGTAGVCVARVLPARRVPASPSCRVG